MDRSRCIEWSQICFVEPFALKKQIHYNNSMKHFAYLDIETTRLMRSKPDNSIGPLVKRVRFFAAVLIGIGVLVGGCKARKTKFVTIGTGGVTGIYYPTGGDISKLVNRKFDQSGINATV